MEEYQQGQTYLEYILNNVAEINNLQQQSFDWRHDCHGDELPIIVAAIQNHPEFALATNQLPDVLSRDDVQNAFEKDNYEGVIATVLWGGGHRGPYNHLEDILLVGHQTISTNIQRIKELLDGNQVMQAFISMKRIPQGENYINGIAESFFTKILYFITRGIQYDALPRPLIWDQFLQSAHCAILIDSEGINHYDYYSFHNGILRFQQNKESLYMDYITRMNDLCIEYGITRPDQLESFLFGKKWPNNMWNPRYVTKQYILNNFNNE